MTPTSRRILTTALALLLFAGCDDAQDTPPEDSAGYDTTTAVDTSSDAVSEDTTETDTDEDTSATDATSGDTTETDTSEDTTLPDAPADTSDMPSNDADAPSDLETLLAALAADPRAALQAQSEATGWPAPVEGGHLFVTTDPGLTHVAGDHDDWSGTALSDAEGFRWIVLQVSPGSRYKFTDLAERWEADPWSRAYHYDDFGVMSRLPPAEPHLERFFAVTDGVVPPRRVRVWRPDAATPITHVLYVHDGQNLFDPGAIGGGWKLQQSAPAGMMLVGIDNIGAGRMDEYTPVADDLGDGVVGGGGDTYADFIQDHVRPLIRDHYGEPDRVGTMGSSLGGLISFHIAHRFPGEYHFAASLSGTMGWGSIGPHNETIIERYDAADKRDTYLYLDSGGGVDGVCADTDADGIEDDVDNSDNYCTNKQLEAVLIADGYTAQSEVWHWWEPDAPHNEAAWAARVFRPLEIFAGL